jgi:hypothetical protein
VKNEGYEFNASYDHGDQSKSACHRRVEQTWQLLDLEDRLRLSLCLHHCSIRLPLLRATCYLVIEYTQAGSNSCSSNRRKPSCDLNEYLKDEVQPGRRCSMDCSILFSQSHCHFPSCQSNLAVFVARSSTPR